MIPRNPYPECTPSCAELSQTFFLEIWGQQPGCLCYRYKRWQMDRNEKGGEVNWHRLYDAIEKQQWSELTEMVEGINEVVVLKAIIRKMAEELVSDEIDK